MSKTGPVEIIPANQQQNEEINDLREGAEFGFRHGLDTHWMSPAFHIHPHYEFYLFIQGQVQILIEDESFDAHPQELFIFPPGLMHRAQILDYSCPYERAYFYATPRMLSEMSDSRIPILRVLEESVSRGHYSYHISREDADAFLRLVDDCSAAEEEPDAFSVSMNRCRVNLLSLITCRTVQSREALTPRPPNRTSEIIRFINDHLLDPLTLESLSERFFISKYTMLHDFKNYTNLYVHQYILYKRVNYAQHLMQRGVTPGDAARQSGFNDYAGFYRVFVRQNGLSPQTYFSQARLDAGTVSRP